MKVTFAIGSFLVMPFLSKKLQIHDALLLTATAATHGFGKQYTYIGGQTNHSKAKAISVFLALCNTGFLYVQPITMRYQAVLCDWLNLWRANQLTLVLLFQNLFNFLIKVPILAIVMYAFFLKKSTHFLFIAVVSKKCVDISESNYSIFILAS